MLGILMAFLSPMAYAGSNIFDAFVAGKVFKKITTVIFYAGITNCLGIPILLCFGMPKLMTWEVFPYFFLYMLFEVLYMIPYYMALKRIDTSLVAALFSLAQVFLPILAYYMVNEKLAPLQYLGFSIVIFFNVVLNLEPTKKFKINMGFWLMLIASILVVIQAVLLKRVLVSFDWISTSFYSILVFNLLIAGMLLLPKWRKDIVCSFPDYIKRWKMFGMMEVCDRVGSMTMIFALSLTPVVIVDTIGAVQPIFVLLYGYILYKLFGNKFKEDISQKLLIKKFVCFIFIIIGVALTVGI